VTSLKKTFSPGGDRVPGPSAGSAVLDHPEVPVSHRLVEGAVKAGPAQLGEHLPQLPAHHLGAAALEHPFRGRVPVGDAPLAIQPAAALGVGAEPPLQVGPGGEGGGLGLDLPGHVDDVGEDGRAPAGMRTERDPRPLAVADLTRAGPDAVAMDEVPLVTRTESIHHGVDEGDVCLVHQLEPFDVAAEHLRCRPAEHPLGSSGPQPERAVLVCLDHGDGKRVQMLEHRAALLDRRAEGCAGHVAALGDDGGSG